MLPTFRGIFGALAIALIAPAGAVHAADPLPAEVRLVAAATAPTVLPGNPSSITVSGPQNLTLTLTDLAFPAAMNSASVAVTQAGTLVASTSLTAGATTATLALPAAGGTYSIDVVGVPGSNASVGTFQVCVAPTSSPSSCIANGGLFHGSVTAPATSADPTLSYFSTDLTVTAAGNYTFTASDLVFPTALHMAPSMALFQGGAPYQVPLASGTPVSLSAGTYTLLAFAQADQTSKAGLYGISVSGPGGVPVLLNNTLPVGLLPAGAPFANPAAQSLKLTVVDYAFPAALQSASALLTSGASPLATATAAGGAVTVAAPQGPLELWTYATAGTGAGTYSADVAGATDLFTAAHGVPGGGASYAYAFVVSPALAAGTAFQASATDLQFPAQLNGVTFAVAQNGSLTKQANPGASIAFTPAATGAVVLLAGATAPSTSGACTPMPACSAGYGLIDVSVQTAAATPVLVYDHTQTVGSSASLFDSQILNIGSASANFDVSVADLKFPAAFANLALVVSQGGTVLGKIYGGGKFSFPGTAGSAYQLTFAATPAATGQFGLYQVSTVFSAPSATLSSSAASAASGSLITLSWAITNATSCTASGGNFTGSITPGTGSQSVRLDATTTYTLSCTGPGGSASPSTTVTATAAASGSHGGGALEVTFLGFLALMGFARLSVSQFAPRSR